MASRRRIAGIDDDEAEHATVAAATTIEAAKRAVNACLPGPDGRVVAQQIESFVRGLAGKPDRVVHRLHHDAACQLGARHGGGRGREP